MIDGGSGPDGVCFNPLLAWGAGSVRIHVSTRIMTNMYDGLGKVAVRLASLFVCIVLRTR